jgi:methionyl-tRNA synthetase
MPFTAQKLVDMLGLGTITWADLGRRDLLNAGSQLGEAVLLFEKIEDADIEKQIAKLEEAKRLNQINSFKAEPQLADVEFDTFMKADLRVGTVLECERVPKADKLLKFLIDDGLEKRTIVSGIAQHYKPEDLVGKQVVFIANLAPRKLKGVVSQGMILSAENADGSLTVISPSAPATPGARIK